MLKLPQFIVSGTPAAMGQAYGEQVRAAARAFTQERLRAARVYLRERGIRDEAAFLDLGRQCLERLREWHHDGWIEHCATATGAGLDPVELYTAGNMTDIRDILTLPVGAVKAADAEGCSTVLIAAEHAQDGEVIAGQTWDLNPGDLEFVVAVHRRPTDSPATWSITCAGCPSLIGMNEHGLAVGTTNIKIRGSRVGIPYLSLQHRALACRDRAVAGAQLRAASRAAAHTYWYADETGVEDWECSADAALRREATSVLTRTNHCLMASHHDREGEPASPSSRARLAHITAAAPRLRTVGDVRHLFADRSDGIDSINRFAEDGQGTSTNACLIAEPAARRLHVCRGSADRGEWVTLGF